MVAYVVACRCNVRTTHLAHFRHLYARMVHISDLAFSSPLLEFASKFRFLPSSPCSSHEASCFEPTQQAVRYTPESHRPRHTYYLRTQLRSALAFIPSGRRSARGLLDVMPVGRSLPDLEVADQPSSAPTPGQLLGDAPTTTWFNNSPVPASPALAIQGKP